MRNPEREIDALLRWVMSVLIKLLEVCHDEDRTRGVAIATLSALMPSRNPRLDGSLSRIDADQQMEIRARLSGIRTVIRKLLSSATNPDLSKSLTTAAVDRIRESVMAGK